MNQCCSAQFWIRPHQKAHNRDLGGRFVNLEYHRRSGNSRPHYDLVVIATQIGSWRIKQLLVDEGSRSSILFANCFDRMELQQNHIYEESRNVYGFDGHNSDPIGHVSLDVTLMGKVLTIDFLLMGCKLHYNDILGRD